MIGNIIKPNDNDSDRFITPIFPFTFDQNGDSTERQFKRIGPLYVANFSLSCTDSQGRWSTTQISSGDKIATHSLNLSGETYIPALALDTGAYNNRVRYYNVFIILKTNGDVTIEYSNNDGSTAPSVTFVGLYGVSFAICND